MKTAPYSKPHSSTPQYRIYAYNTYNKGALGRNKWVLLQSDLDKELILKAAKKLKASKRFEKIEVKEKLFNAKKKRHQIKTIKSFKSRRHPSLKQVHT